MTAHKHILRIGLLVAALALAAPLPGRAQESATIVGQVSAADGSPLPSAALRLEGADGRLLRAGRTDARGNFRFVGLSAGSYRLRVTHLGYREALHPVSLAAGAAERLVLVLEIAVLDVEGVQVAGRREGARERARFETDAGITSRVLGGGEIRGLPALFEADVLRAVELLPGVVSTSDYSSSFNVRGGSADQNLILIDGFPIFNPFHLGGLFSVFNADMIAAAELLAGGFGAEHGGRVSSVLTVESRLAEEGPRVDAGVSVLAARATVALPLGAARAQQLGVRGAGISLSARRSYFDRLLRPVLEFPYHLTDLQGNAHLDLPGGARIVLTGYSGQDVLNLEDFEGEGAEALLRLRWDWGNDVIGGRGTFPLGAWVLTSRLGLTRFATGLDLTDFPDTRFASEIRQSTVALDLHRELGGGSLAVGGEYAGIRAHNLGEGGGTVFFDGRHAGSYLAAYTAATWRRGRWLAQPGARVEGWSGNRDVARLAPRLAVKRFLGADERLAARLAVGRYVQFVQSLRDEEVPFSIDIWVATGAAVPPVISDQVQLGLEGYWGGERGSERWSASAEVYARSFSGVLDFNVADDPNDPLDDFLIGSGGSHGVDLYLRRRAEALSGWISLSFLRAERRFPDVLGREWDELPDELEYPPIWDRRINLNAVAQYRVGGWEASARWGYGSGLPYTRPVAQHLGWQYQMQSSIYRPRDEEFTRYVVLGERNVNRYPAYHRLDVGVRREFARRWGSWTPYLQVVNLYDRRNVLFYFFDYDRSPPIRSGISMFPVLPSLGVDVSFR
jgi:hypothetical protein